MNHQIQNNGYIGTAGVVGSQTMGFNKARRQAHSGGPGINRIKAFDVPHLRLDPGLAGHVEHFKGLSRGAGQRLFDEQMLEATQGHQSQIVMRKGGGHNIHGIHQVHQSFGLIKARDPKDLDCLGQSQRIRVVDPHHVEPLRQFEQAFEMDFAEVPSPQKGHANRGYRKRLCMHDCDKLKAYTL